MGFLFDRRVILGAAVFIMHRDPGSKAPPPASRGGLVVEEGREESLDPVRPLRCFVAGQLAGTMTLAECAKKNGVATRALDLGVDSTGALAAASDAGPVVQPLTVEQAQAVPTQAPLLHHQPAARSGRRALGARIAMHDEDRRAQAERQRQGAACAQDHPPVG